MTRTQLALAILSAVLVAFAVGWLARGGGLEHAGERFRDTAAALKKLYRERVASPRQNLTPPDSRVPSNAWRVTLGPDRPEVLRHLLERSISGTRARVAHHRSGAITPTDPAG